MLPIKVFLHKLTSVALSFCCAVRMITCTPVQELHFDPDAAMRHEEYAADVSHLSDGVLMFKCPAGSDSKIIIEKDGTSVCYTAPNDGEPFSLPLSEGSGIYMVSVMEHLQGITYRQSWQFPVECGLADPFAPYLHPNLYVPYEEGDKCVEAAAGLNASSPSTAAFLKSVEKYVEEHVEYDYGYNPGTLADHCIDPDMTLEAGRGICLDQASLVTAMCRSQGVPAKLVFGNVAIGGEHAYHAWALAWDGLKWAVLDPCMPDGYAAVYEPAQQF